MNARFQSNKIVLKPNSPGFRQLIPSPLKWVKYFGPTDQAREINLLKNLLKINLLT